MPAETELLRVVERLYAATVDRALWRRALHEVAGLKLVPRARQGGGS